jgi:MFS family permease
VIFALGIAWGLWRFDENPNYLVDMLPGQVLVGFGIGMVQPLMTVVAAASLPPTRFATGGGIINVARQIGTVLGIAILVAILGSTPGLDEFRAGWWLMIGIAAVSIILALPIRRSPPATA